MKNLANNTKTQQNKKAGGNKWMRWALVAVVIGLLAGDGILNGRWSDITLAGSEEEAAAAPSELVVDEAPTPEPEPEPEPEPAPAPEVTESVPAPEKPADAVITEAAPAAQDEVEKEGNAQDAENKEQTEQTAALAADAQAVPVEALPLEEVAEQPAVERTVKIHSSLEDAIGMDDTFSMTAELDGFDGVTYHVQWQRNEGFGWEDIAGANDLVLVLPANALSTQAGYRLVVTVD